MTWSEVVAESTQNLTHQTRPLYVPPFLRENGATLVSNLSAESPPFRPTPRFNSPELDRSPRGGSGRGYNNNNTRGGGGRGGGRNSFRGRGGSNSNSNSNLNPNRNGNTDGLVNKFEEQLQVRGEEDENVNSNAINFDAYEDIPVEVTGSDVPKPVASFGEIDLDEALYANIQRCKYVKPTPIQRHAIPISIAGRDLMACAQTGSGKTAAFCFPIIYGILKDRFKHVAPVSGVNGVTVAYPSALILSPTRELSIQIHDEAKKFAYQTGVKIVVVYGGAPISQQFYYLEKGVDILVATPGRLVDLIDRGRISLQMLRYLALDEADRMLDMGFEQQIRKIVEQTGMPPPGKRQTMLFSATFPDQIQRLASDFLSNYIFLSVGRVGSSTDLIAQRVELVQDMDKRSHLFKLLRTQKATGTRGKPALTLVFVETKRGADSLEHWLCTNGFPAIAIHGDKVQRERERALRSFKFGSTPILVATDVASRGLDIPHVAHVINFDMPKDIDDYVHRIGRTGRAGNSGLATAFFNDKNQSLAKPLLELMQEGKQEIPTWLTQYAENSSFGGGGYDRSYGRSKFGGSDFRGSSQHWSENNYNSSTNGDVNSAVDPYATGSNGVGYAAPANSEYYTAPANSDYYADANDGSYGDNSNAADYHAPAAVDSYAAGNGNFDAAGYASIVPSGWD